MIELKAFNCVESDVQEFCEPRLAYLKSEADKVIAEKDKVIAEKDADYKEACGRLQTANLIKDEQLAATRHHKYHRCLNMAARCESEEKRLDAIAPLFDNDKECWEYSSDFLSKWARRWLKIAEEFKEEK